MAIPPEPTAGPPGKDPTGSAGKTASLCPVCLKRIGAERRKADGEVRLIKHCPEHGDFCTPIWRGPPSWDDWQRPKLPSPPRCRP